MKLVQISITGMHKITQKSYDLGDMTYFVGENGAGKSTILEAIQLAILGYIPGYAKTNESIMKHASGPVMAVVAKFENPDIAITRTWTRAGSSVTSNVDIKGASKEEFADLIKDIELPIFNFNEFRSMTSNKLKEWFISFLPSSMQELNLSAELEHAASERALPYEDVLARINSWIASSNLSGVDLVKGLNTYLKDDQSFVKGQIAKLQGTIESLVRYDDADDLDEEELKSKYNLQQTLISQATQYAAKEQMLNSAKANLAAAKNGLNAETFDADPRVEEINSRCDELEKEIAVLKADYSDIQHSLQELMAKRARIQTSEPVCPYTKASCETAAKFLEPAKKEAEELDKQIAFKREEIADCDPAKVSMLQSELTSLMMELNSLKSKYQLVAGLEAQIVDIGPAPLNPNIAELRAEADNIQQQLIKLAANKRYDELSEQVTKDKFELENELEILKIWIKLTDANGLQSTMMNKPFEDLASDMSNYLSSMFGSEVTASFNLVSKANSFSFGLVRNGQYIEFDYLSSGEKCLFTLALILCILDRSQTQLRTIVIDDILDHLDGNNAEYLFDTLKKVDSVQFILAGVKECKDEGICFAV